MKNRYFHKLKNPSYLGLAMSAGLAIIGCSVFILEASRLIKLQQKYAGTVELVQILRDTIDDLQDMETSQRGYLLTHRTSYLEPFNRGCSALKGHLNKLESTVAYIIPQDKGMAIQLRKLAKAKENVLAETIRFEMAGKYQQALSIINSDKGEFYMDQIRQLEGDYTEAYRTLRFRYEQETTNHLVWAIVVLIVWIASLATLVTTVFWQFRNTQKQLKARTEQLNLEATHDALTGLPNRRYLNDWLNNMISRSAQSNETVSALYIDLDGFSDVNNTYGHNIGDIALQWAANTLRSTLRDSDFLARLGGDEFIVITSGQTMEQLQLLAERLTDVLASSSPNERIPNGTLGASIGIAMSPLHASTAEQLIIKADCAMYEAKRDGKDCYRVATP
jgi:diguanylate cyclase (GGDEF)-like protein